MPMIVAALNPPQRGAADPHLFPECCNPKFGILVASGIQPGESMHIQNSGLSTKGFHDRIVSIKSMSQHIGQPLKRKSMANIRRTEVKGCGSKYSTW